MRGWITHHVLLCSVIALGSVGEAVLWFAHQIGVR